MMTNFPKFNLYEIEKIEENKNKKKKKKEENKKNINNDVDFFMEDSSESEN